MLQCGAFSLGQTTVAPTPHETSLGRMPTAMSNPGPVFCEEDENSGPATANDGKNTNTAGDVSSPRSCADEGAAVAHARLALHMGDNQEAIKRIRAALRIDPLSTLGSIILQNALDRIGQFDEAEAEYQRSLDLPGGRAANAGQL